MITYQVALSDEQATVLAIIASEAGRTPQEVIDEQVTFYLKEMLNREVKAHGITIENDPERTDTEKAQVAAVMLKAKDEFLRAKSEE